jgi:hypothetical protein
MATTTDQFLSRATERTENLKREIALLEAQESGVRRRRLELEKDAADWERAVELYTETMQPDSPVGTPVEDRPKQPVAHLIETFLSEQPERQAKVAEIAAWLAHVGRFPSGAQASGQNYSMAYNALLRNRDRFAKSGRGEWRLLRDAPEEDEG